MKKATKEWKTEEQRNHSLPVLATQTIRIESSQLYTRNKLIASTIYINSAWKKRQYCWIVRSIGLSKLSYFMWHTVKQRQYFAIQNSFIRLYKKGEIYFWEKKRVSFNEVVSIYNPIRIFQLSWFSFWSEMYLGSSHLRLDTLVKSLFQYFTI